MPQKGYNKAMEKNCTQLTIEKDNHQEIFIKKERSCVFTGHRELGEFFSCEKLKDVLKECVKNEVNTFYCGMAQGFDLLAGKEILSLKRKDKKIKLIACIPYYGQEKNFSQKDKELYLEIYKNSDEKVVISENYYRGCTLTRNRYMADNADMMIAYLKKETGGTAYTVRYFQKKYPQKNIIFL